MTDHQTPQQRSRNMARDAANRHALATAGWQVAVIWECETRDTDALRRRLEQLVETKFAEPAVMLQAVAEETGAYSINPSSAHQGIERECAGGEE